MRSNNVDQHPWFFGKADPSSQEIMFLFVCFNHIGTFWRIVCCFNTVNCMSHIKEQTSISFKLAQLARECCLIFFLPTQSGRCQSALRILSSVYLLSNKALASGWLICWAMSHMRRPSGKMACIPHYRDHSQRSEPGAWLDTLTPLGLCLLTAGNQSLNILTNSSSVWDSK